MYKLKNIRQPNTSIIALNSYIGETIEEKVDRIVNNKEPIKDGAPIIYTERKDGVNPNHDIRTDRFDVAIEAMDVVNRSWKAKRDENIKSREDAKVIKIDKPNEGTAKEGEA